MNTWISSKTSKVVFLLLLGLIFISHFPFIEADPDRNMAVGRGPFTDEGLNTIQARNWVIHDQLDLRECDNLLKTPLLGFPLALTYKVFGVSHAISRVHILVLVFLGFLIIGLDKGQRDMMVIFSLISLFQYQVFHSSHYSMAEMLSVASVILSIHFLARSLKVDLSNDSRVRQAILSGIFLSLSYFFKIQFIYLIALLPLALAILYFSTNYVLKRIIIRQGMVIMATLLFFLLIYLVAWYLPNKEAYDYMMTHQSGELTLSGKMLEYIRFNISYHFLNGWVQWFVYFFLALVIYGFFILKKAKSSKYRVLFFTSLVWFMLEMHKLIMVYLPTRYQVSLFASMGLLMSVVIIEIFSLPGRRDKYIIKATAMLMLIAMISVNTWQYFDAFRNRTFAIREINTYLAQNLAKDDVVLGAWAPSLTWKAMSKAIPVWNNFLNYQDPITKFHPKTIIAESDEQDSEQAWQHQGINLNEIADSSRTFRIGQWDVNIYWLKVDY